MTGVLLSLLLLLPSATFDEAFRAGLIALQQGQLTVAASNLENAVGQQPSNARAWVALAQTYSRQRDSTRANAAAARAAALGKSDEVVVRSLGIYYDEAAQALLQQEKFAETVSLLQAAGALGKNPQFQMELGVAYYGLRRFDEAAAAFLSAIDGAPDNKPPYLMLGKMLNEIPAHLIEATDRFARYEKAHPNDPDGYLLHAKALDARVVQPEKARALLDQAIALGDNGAAVHFELGNVLDRLQRYGEAAKELERAAALDPADAATHYRLARLYDRLGRPIEAEQERERHRRLVVAANTMR